MPEGACAAYDAHVPVYGCYPLVRACLEQLARDELLQCQHDSILAPYADSCAAVLYRLDCILDLVL
jgi:hypothetical protein